MKADDRIEKLLERASYPGMQVLNNENAALKRLGFMKNVQNIARESFDGNLYLYIERLVNTIDRLEGALENVLNERDALIADVKNTSVTACEICVRRFPGGGERSEDCDFACRFCKTPCACKDCDLHNESFEWRGIQEEQEEAE